MRQLEVALNRTNPTAANVRVVRYRKSGDHLIEGKAGRMCDVCGLEIINQVISASGLLWSVSVHGTQHNGSHVTSLTLCGSKTQTGPTKTNQMHSLIVRLATWKILIIDALFEEDWWGTLGVLPDLIVLMASTQSGEFTKHNYHWQPNSYTSIGVVKSQK